MKLISKQEHAVYYLKDNTTTEILYGGAAGGGKSAIGCLWLIESCQMCPNSRWLMGRAKLKTLKETTLKTFFELTSKLGISEQYNYNAQSGVITWDNGSEILLKDLFAYPSDPEFDELGSLEVTGAFIDEVSQITFKAWQIVKSRIRYKLDEFGLIPKLLGTANPTHKWAYSKFYKPNKDGTLKANKKFIQALPTDNPHLPASYLETLLGLDDNSKQRLYFGNWEYDDDPSALCNYNDICDVFTNTHVNKGTKRISADLAMQGRDSFIAGYWEGLICTVAIDKPKANGKSIELDLTNLKNSKGVGNSNIVADSDGLGAYLESYINNIKTFHGGARAYNNKDYDNLKSECGFKLASVISNHQLKINCTFEQEEFIKRELSICLKRDNIDIDKKKLIKKDEMKKNLGKSPDYLDMLLMGMVFELMPQKKAMRRRI